MTESLGEHLFGLGSDTRGGPLADRDKAEATPCSDVLGQHPVASSSGVSDWRAASSRRAAPISSTSLTVMLISAGV